MGYSILQNVPKPVFKSLIMNALCSTLYLILIYLPLGRCWLKSVVFITKSLRICVSPVLGSGSDFFLVPKNTKPSNTCLWELINP